MILLLGEVINRCKSKSHGVVEFERRLSSYGVVIGERILESYIYCEMRHKREIKIPSLLMLLKNGIWKYMFGYMAEKLEQSRNDPLKYMLTDLYPITNLYTEIPVDYGQLSSAAWIAGIVEGIINAAGFKCTVSAHNSPDSHYPFKTIYLITFVGSSSETPQIA